MLRTFLYRRFGELPPDVRDRIDRAPDEDVRRWLDRVMTAESLEAALD
jgi:hypothetical protein